MKKRKARCLPEKWACFIKFLLLTSLIIAPQKICAADKTLSGGESLSLDADTTWDNLFSSATAENWAVITGPYDIRVTGSTDIQFVSFQNTGSIKFENETLIEHCVFDGNADIAVGTTTTPLNTDILIEASDFRNQINTTVLKISSSSGDSIGRYQIKRNSFYYTTKKVILLNKRNGCLFTENVVYNMELGNLIGTNWNIAGGHTYSKNFLSSDQSVTNYRTLAVNGGAPPVTFDNNYCYYDVLNPHPFTITNSGSTGTDHYTNNILEVEFNFDGANLFNANSARPVEVSHNIHIGSGSLCNTVGGDARQPITINNNTCYSTLAGNAGDGLLFLSESGPSTGTIDIFNNIVTGATDPESAVNSITGIQDITYSDYNSFFNVTTHYEHVNVISGQLNDITENPKFLHSTRNLFMWDISKGGAGTKANVVNSFAGVNGYNGATKKQSDPPAGYFPWDLITWVRYGFTPTNTALQGTGREGVDIGAVSFSTVTDLSIIINDIQITTSQ